MKLIGKISGMVKPTTFNILLTESGIERGSYIKIKHDVYGWVLARISTMKRYLDEFDDEIMMAAAHTVGYKKDDDILIPKTPFKPEESVYIADKSMITDILGLKRNRTGNIYIGLLEGYEIPVYLNIKKTIGKHVSILAKTGAGKSYTVAVILEELLKNNIPIVVIDPHGEYSSLRLENDDYDAMLEYNVRTRSYADKVLEYSPNVEVNQSAQKLALKSQFDMIELTNMIPVRLSDRQKSILYETLRRLEGSDYTLENIIEEVSNDPSKSKWKVISGLEALAESGVFSGTPITPNKLVTQGKISIINLRGVEPHIQQLIVAKISRDLFDARRVGHIPEFFFLIEEAHNFCPERGYGITISSSILRDIASEGRKFGLHLCVVSQRPARIDKNVLSQCNTQIILKVTNPNDLRAISQSIEGFTSGMESEIKQLPVGHALVVGECVEQPITVDVRVRETKHVGTTPPIMPREEEEPIKKKKVLEKKEDKTFLGRIRSLFLRD